MGGKGNKVGEGGEAAKRGRRGQGSKWQRGSDILDIMRQRPKKEVYEWYCVG